jgi:hypothetical protein
MQQLDPHPQNILGKGIIPPHIEAVLLANGAVFAMYVTTDGPKPQTYLRTSSRPWNETVPAINRDIRKFNRDQRLKTPIAA